jgi:hypothetical protein
MRMCVLSISYYLRYMFHVDSFSTASLCVSSFCGLGTRHPSVSKRRIWRHDGGGTGLIRNVLITNQTIRCHSPANISNHRREDLKSHTYLVYHDMKTEAQAPTKRYNDLPDYTESHSGRQKSLFAVVKISVLNIQELFNNSQAVRFTAPIVTPSAHGICIHFHTLRLSE